MDDPKYRNVQHKQADGQPLAMMQIISKNQGWITVGTETQDRKHPVEKQRLGDFKKVNVLSPEWMQVTHTKPGTDPLEAATVKHGVRQEVNRTFLVEKNQPKKSVFEIGSHRHNLPTRELTDEWQKKAVDQGKLTLNPHRMIHWDEPEPQKQKYDKHVSPKIGSLHFC